MISCKFVCRRSVIGSYCGPFLPNKPTIYISMDILSISELCYCLMCCMLLISCSKIFHWHRDVTFAVKIWKKIYTFAFRFWSMSSERSSTHHTCSDKRPWYMLLYSSDRSISVVLYQNQGVLRTYSVPVLQEAESSEKRSCRQKQAIVGKSIKLHEFTMLWCHK